MVITVQGAPVYLQGGMRGLLLQAQQAVVPADITGPAPPVLPPQITAAMPSSRPVAPVPRATIGPALPVFRTESY